jgi:hypothetical protein
MTLVFSGFEGGELGLPVAGERPAVGFSILAATWNLIFTLRQYFGGAFALARFSTIDDAGLVSGAIP